MGGTARQGRVRMRTPDPGTCPTHTAPQLPQRGWRMVGGPGARRQRLGWGAGWPLVPPPPQASRPGSIHRLPSCPHIRPSPDINPHQGPRSLFLFCPPLPSPTRIFFFFSPPLSLPTCHYSRNKKCWDNAGIDEGPLAAPSPHGACQHSFHPPRAGTAAKGALLINKRNQINQEHNRGICCT